MGQSRDEINRGMAALQARLPDPTCPMCRATSWSVGTTTLEPSDGFPLRLLQLTCGQCAFTALHDLDALGVK